MTAIIEIQCDRCGVTRQSASADNSLPEGWRHIETTDAQDEVVTSEDLCPPCYDVVEDAMRSAMAAGEE